MASGGFVSFLYLIFYYDTTYSNRLFIGCRHLDGDYDATIAALNTIVINSINVFISSKIL